MFTSVSVLSAALRREFTLRLDDVFAGALSLQLQQADLALRVLTCRCKYAQLSISALTPVFEAAPNAAAGACV